MNKGKLYTSYFSKLKYGKGVKISVARYNPKWLNNKYIDNWFLELAPSKDLLKDYKDNRITKNDFRKRYLSEQNLITINRLKTLLDNGQDVTIYCYEKPSDFCHRHIIGDLFRSIGYEVEEIEF